MTRAPIFDALARLPEWRMVRTGQYKACCPAHDDHDPSLDISIGADGRVLLICRSQGCTAEAIVTALGATMADLFEPRAPDDAKGKGTGRGRTETHRYPAYDAETGKAVGVHVRKDTWDANGVKLPKRMWWEPKGIKLPPLALYGIADAQQAKANGGRLTVIVTEGERKRDELHAALAKAGRLDWVAVGTMTGAGVTPCDAALRALAGCDVVLWPDNADDGRLHMQRIGARLDALGVTGWRWLDWPDAPSKGDASDYVAVGGTVAGLDALIRRSSERKQSSTPNDHLSEWDAGSCFRR
jgi:putative DNA primase/helicase